MSSTNNNLNNQSNEPLYVELSNIEPLNNKQNLPPPIPPPRKQSQIIKPHNSIKSKHQHRTLPRIPQQHHTIRRNHNINKFFESNLFDMNTFPYNFDIEITDNIKKLYHIHSRKEKFPEYNFINEFTNDILSNINLSKFIKQRELQYKQWYKLLSETKNFNDIIDDIANYFSEDRYKEFIDLNNNIKSIFTRDNIDNNNINLYHFTQLVLCKLSKAPKCKIINTGSAKYTFDEQITTNYIKYTNYIMLYHLDLMLSKCNIKDVVLPIAMVNNKINGIHHHRGGRKLKKSYRAKNKSY